MNGGWDKIRLSVVALIVVNVLIAGIGWGTLTQKVVGLELRQAELKVDMNLGFDRLERRMEQWQSQAKALNCQRFETTIGYDSDQGWSMLKHGDQVICSEQWFVSPFYTGEMPAIPSLSATDNIDGFRR